TAKLMRNLQTNPDTAGLRLRACSSTAEAVRDADIVTTVTADKTNATIIEADMLRPGMHLNAVGGDCPGKTEIHRGALAAAKVFVEYEPQTRVEGDLQQMAPDFAVTELWQVLSGQKAGRDDAGQITMFDSVGFALEDFSALRYLHAMARSLNLGRMLPLIPLLADPKNLYHLVRPQVPGATGKQPAARQAVCA
ncbi:MAG: ornithine cyclodeaminase, partial [Polaromonas sp.]